MAGRCSSARQYVTTSCTDPEAFRTWRSQDLRQAASVLIQARQRHAAGEIPLARVEEIQQAYGYRFTTDGIIADEELSRFIDWPNVFKYDWVHIMLSGGVMVHAAWCVFAACEEHGLPGQAELFEFLKGWQVPKAAQFGSRDVRTLWRFFDPKSVRENRKRQGVRCNASELLALSRCLEEFVSIHVPDDERVAAHKAFFFAARQTLDLLMRAKTGIATCREVARPLASSCRDQLARFIEIHDHSEVIPKFHWAFSIAEQMSSTDFVMDAFVIERLHIRARLTADRTMWQQDYEASLCAGIINAQVGGTGSSDGLEGKVSQFPHPGLSHVKIADRVYSHGKRLNLGDWVWRPEELGQVVACVEESGELYIIVTVASAVRALSPRGRLCTLSGGARSLWRLAESNVVAAWRQVDGSDQVHVVL